MGGPFIIIVLAVLGIGAAGGLAYWVRSRPGPEEVFHFNCPGCGRRFRYRPKQIGHQGQCPHCDNRFTFPTPRAVKR